MINENINNTFTKKDQHDLSVSKQKTRRSINNSILSTTKRSHSQSSKSKRSLPKIAPPIDPKLYRVSITFSTNNTIKKKKTKKRNRFLFKIPKSGDSMRDSLPQKKIEETINNITTFNQRKDIKFVSMRSFNIAKMSWSKEKDNNNINNNIEQKKVKRKLKNSKNKADSDKPEYSHFSDIRKRIRRKTRFNTVSLDKKRKVNNSFSKGENKLKSISENKNYVKNKLILNQKINYNSNLASKIEGSWSKEKIMNESKQEIHNLSINNNVNSLGTRNTKNLINNQKETVNSEKPPNKNIINNKTNTYKKNSDTFQSNLVQNPSQQSPNKSRAASLSKINSNCYLL